LGRSPQGTGIVTADRQPLKEIPVKVAYILNTPKAASYKVQKMVLPQLEAGTHGVEVVGIFFFDDNVWALRKDDPIG
jgi:hypothetical protein